MRGIGCGRSTVDDLNHNTKHHHGQFRLSTYVAPGAAGMYKSNNVS